MEYKSTEQERTRAKAYYHAHKEERKAYNHAYYAKNKQRYQANNKAWRQKHKERIDAYGKAYRQSHIEEIRAMKRSYAQAHRPQHLAWRKAFRIRIKEQAFQAYGGAICACCKETHSEFLSIDHIAGGGNKHRQQVKGLNFYHWLRLQGYPSGFRVLCMNCNFASGHFGSCPHGNLDKTRQPFRQTNLWRPSQNGLSTPNISAHPSRNGSGEGRQPNLISLGDNTGNGP